MSKPRAAPALDRLAAAVGVAITYGNWRHEPQEVPRDTVRAVLAAMGVDAADDDAATAALDELEQAPWRHLVPPSAVVRAGAEAEVLLTLPVDGAVAVEVVAQDGTRLPVAVGPPGESRVLDGRRLVRRPGRLPTGLPLGDHALRVRAGEREEQAHLLVVPRACPVPQARTWGWQVQLYTLRSAASWGIGDLGDLRTLVSAAGREHGAGLVLLNPLHAAVPLVPVEPSPYSPASRRFTNPLYLRVEDCDGYADLDPGGRAEVDALGAGLRGTAATDRIDRDPVLTAKLGALAVLAARELPAARARAFADFRAASGTGLEDFATACALAEVHGPDRGAWPARLQDPRGDAVAAARHQLADRVHLHTWLQWQCDEQLAAAQAAARAAGMPIGLVADLAVGVNPGGADAWALQADLAQGMTVGAPPDSFNQRGQDWGLPPLRPDRLPLTGYAPFRDLVRANLRHAGGLRIDHAMGLFRLFWVPAGGTPAEGTYVRYPAEALLGVLALEAETAGAVVVGEDLGTVEKGVPETLRAAGVLGSRVLWFERTEPDDSHPEGVRLPAAEYPQLALTSITTHDLPTAAGFLADEPARVRAALDQLGHSEAEERARTAHERTEVRALLVDEGLIAEDADDQAVAEAMHAFVARTPSLLVTVALGDAVGDLRQPNLPGTVDQYPNWRLPVATPDPTVPEDPDGLLPPSRPVPLEELLADDRVARLAEVLRTARR